MTNLNSYVLFSLLLLFNFIALLIFYSADIIPTAPGLLPGITTLFFMTYLLDLGLHFYYLKNDHLDKAKPRMTLTALRIFVLLGLFYTAYLNR